MNLIRRVKRKFFPKYFLDDYQLEHRKLADQILRSIESERGKTDPQHLRQADEYAKEVLGWKGYAPWLYVYSAVAGHFQEGWIPDNYYGKMVVPAMKGLHGKIVTRKSLAGKLFNHSAFPNLAYHTNGLFLSNGYQPLQETELKELLFGNAKKVVFKLDDSIQGKGIFFFEEANFDAEKVKRMGNGVFQEFIEQHPFFDSLMPGSVATIRLTTVMEDSGKASVRASYLRLGRSTDTHVQSQSHVRIPVELNSGELAAEGFLHDWTRIDRHPDTGAVFANSRIPGFEKCLSTVLELQKEIPFSRTAGWDLVVDKDNEVKLIECNGGHNDIKFSEAVQGPCFGDLGWEDLWRRK